MCPYFLERNTMKKVLGIDFETTSLDIKKARIIEIGAVVFGVTGTDWDPIIDLSTLVYDEGDMALNEDTIKITGITDAMLKAEGMEITTALEMLADMAAQCDMCVAHNEPYDRGVLKEVVERGAFGLIRGVNPLIEMPWVCSVTDLPQTKEYKCKKLSHLSLDLGITVDPSKLHRAVADVKLMGQMLTAAKADPEEMLKYRNTPSCYVQAVIPAPWTDGGKGKDAAVKLGYSWEKARGDDRVWAKTWVKKIKETDLQEEKRVAPFEVKLISTIA
jgi:DNA polymerase III epsilon subunit-like protein